MHAHMSFSSELAMDFAGLRLRLPLLFPPMLMSLSGLLTGRAKGASVSRTLE